MRGSNILKSSLIIVGIAIVCAVMMLVREDGMNESEKTLSEYEKYALDKIERKAEGKSPKVDQPDIHAAIQRELRTREGALGPEYSENQVLEEYLKAKARMKRSRSRGDDLNFVERGPGNVAGRTRSLIIDPDDASGLSWLAGSASGGIWKTTDFRYMATHAHGNPLSFPGDISRGSGPRHSSQPQH